MDPRVGAMTIIHHGQRSEDPSGHWSGGMFTN